MPEVEASEPKPFPATPDEEMLAKILQEHLDKPVDAMKRDARLVEDLGADSLDFIEIVMAIEEEFDAPIDDDAAENVKTVGDAAVLIARLTGKEAA